MFRETVCGAKSAHPQEILALWHTLWNCHSTIQQLGHRNPWCSTTRIFYIARVERPLFPIVRARLGHKTSSNNILRQRVQLNRPDYLVAPTESLASWLHCIKGGYGSVVISWSTRRGSINMGTWTLPSSPGPQSVQEPKWLCNPCRVGSVKRTEIKMPIRLLVSPGPHCGVKSKWHRNPWRAQGPQS